MKILWVCNILVNFIANKIGYPPSIGGGWIEGLAEDLIQDENVKLGICFPQKRNENLMIGKSELVYYHGFYESGEDDLIKQFKEIIDNFQPDLVHIFGTEYMHSLCAVRACNGKIKSVISIQGMPSVYEKHAYALIPKRVIYGFSLRDIIKRDNVWLNTLNLKKRGKFEIMAIKESENIIGRTDWDEAYSQQINPMVHYYVCNETLRRYFYQKKWKLKECEKHSIFVSQCHKPIKGFHLMLHAMVEIVKKYPDAKLYTTGKNLIDISGGEYQKLTRYQQYIHKLIHEFNLENKVCFCGFLTEETMCERFLNSHVFVSPSSIENSPNSVGEAMLLGVPTVSSDVGGVKNMLTHGIEGYVYPFDEPDMIAYYVCKIFSDDALAATLSEQAVLHASKTHNRKNNRDRMIEIYMDIISN